MRELRRLLCSLVPGSLFPACLPTPTTPIPSVEYPASADRQSDCLVVFLPGRGDAKEDFEKNEFVSSLRDAGGGVDALALDAHVGYYAAQTIPERLELDVIQPAKTKGYKRIFLVGISMGGLGAVSYVDSYPGRVDGLLLIAPFFGSPSIAAEIESGGGLAAWNSPERAGKYKRHWLWLKNYPAAGNDRPRLYLAYGRRDKLAPTHRVLSDVVDPKHVVVNNGTHKWAYWRPLWKAFVRDHGASFCAEPPAHTHPM